MEGLKPFRDGFPIHEKADKKKSKKKKPHIYIEIRITECEVLNEMVQGF